jgi:hypothetical protein
MMNADTDAPQLPDRPHAARAERALIVVGLLAMFFTGGIGPDGMPRYIALGQLIEGQPMTDHPYSMIGPVLATPLWLLGKLLGSARWWTGKFNYVVFLFGVLWLWSILRPHVSASFLRKLILLLMAASLFGRAAMSFYGEMLTTMLVACGILALSYRSSWLAWGAVILGVANTPATLIGLGVFAVVYAVHHRRARYLVAPVLGTIVILAERWIRRGSPFLSGYEGNAGPETIMPYSGEPGFSYPLLLGVLSIFLSFGKGLVFFTPGLFLPARRRLAALHPPLRLAYAGWIAFVVGLVLVYSQWWSWYGGWHWGPRFFLVASWIACFALAAYLVRPSTRALVNLTVLAVVMWSFWVGFDGLMLDQRGLDFCTEAAYRWEALCWYVPEFSPLIHPFVGRQPLDGEDLVVLPFMVAIMSVVTFPLVALTARQSRDGLIAWVSRYRHGWRV